MSVAIIIPLPSVRTIAASKCASVMRRDMPRRDPSCARCRPRSEIWHSRWPTVRALTFQSGATNASYEVVQLHRSWRRQANPLNRPPPRLRVQGTTLIDSKHIFGNHLRVRCCAKLHNRVHLMHFALSSDQQPRCRSWSGCKERAAFAARVASPACCLIVSALAVTTI